jgi:hypothetical protein
LVRACGIVLFVLAKYRGRIFLQPREGFASLANNTTMMIMTELTLDDNCLGVLSSYRTQERCIVDQARWEGRLITGSAAIGTQ